MGLLDSLFDSSTYGGSQGGLLSLLQSPLFQGNVQPSQGFPAQGASFADRFNALPNAPQPVNPAPRQLDASAFDPSTYAPNQAQPIGIGGYQMPRIGSADLYQPQQAMTPANAQPAQGQLPPQVAGTNAQMGALPPSQQPQAAAPSGGGFQLPPALGGGTYLDRLNSGGSLIGSLFSGSPQQQNLKAQYDALVPVVGPQKALLAVMNPEAGKTILTEALTNKNEVKDVQDAFGNHHLMWVNPLKPGVAVGVGGEAGNGAAPAPDLQGMTDNLSRMAQSGASRQEMLQQVPSEYRGYVDAVLSGRALPTNIGRSPARAAIMSIAHAVDPKFDESTIPLRFKTQTDYAPNGQSGRSIVALNTVQHHIGKLSDDLENIDDTGWTAINAIRNGIATNTPLDPKQGRAIQAVQDDIKAVTDEMSSAYKAGRVSDHEIEAWNKLASSNLPVRQLRQGIADFVDLLNGKRDQLNETHNSIIGTDAPGLNKELNATITKRVHDRNAGTANQSSAPSIQEGATATNPQTGQKIVFKGGQWVPVQ